jgi:endonuclease YncB( thermonuclease family)
MTGWVAPKLLPRGRRARRWAQAAALGLTALCAAPAGLGPAQAGERLAGPVPARVIAVIDGDTLEVRAHIWLGQELRTRVRLAGIDAPELEGKCAQERSLAAQARAYLRARLEPGEGWGARVWLRNIRYGKYAGRVLARVETAGGEDLSRGLMAAGLARPYAGRARAAWCEEAGAGPSG